MDDATRAKIAECLERLAEQDEWNPELWQQCHDVVRANWENDLLGFVYDDIVHYSGVFHKRSIFGFRRSPSKYIEDYGCAFRSIAAALRSRMSLKEWKKKYGI